MVWRSSARLAPAPISFTTMNMGLFFRGIHHDDVFGVAIGSIRRHTQISGRRPFPPSSSFPHSPVSLLPFRRLPFSRGPAVLVAASTPYPSLPFSGEAVEL